MQNQLYDNWYTNENRKSIEYSMNIIKDIITEIRKSISINNINRNNINSIYIYSKDNNIKKLLSEKEHIGYIKWMTKIDCIEIIEEN